MLWSDRVFQFRNGKDGNHMAAHHTYGRGKGSKRGGREERGEEMAQTNFGFRCEGVRIPAFLFWAVKLWLEGSIKFTSGWNSTNCIFMTDRVATDL